MIIGFPSNTQRLREIINQNENRSKNVNFGNKGRETWLWESSKLNDAQNALSSLLLVPSIAIPLRLVHQLLRLRFLRTKKHCVACMTSDSAEIKFYYT